MKTHHKLLLYSALTGLLLLVFSMYAQPDFMLSLGNQIWGCY